MTEYVYLNGRFLPEDQAFVTIHDGGWLHGAGLFETMRAENGRIFRLDAHLARLRNSAAVLLRPIELEDLPNEADFRELLDRNGRKTARVRLTVSGGSVRAPEEEAPPRLTVCATASEAWDESGGPIREGVHAVVCNYRQSPSDPLAGHKTTGHLSRLLGMRQAHRARCFEALWFTTGHRLAEGCITNVFLVRDGVLSTPPLDTPVLPGVARGVVLAMAREAGIETRETTLTIDDVLAAAEVFLTNAMLWVTPVTRVERHDVGGGRVGPLARRLYDAYRETVRRECAG